MHHRENGCRRSRHFAMPPWARTRGSQHRELQIVVSDDLHWQAAMVAGAAAMVAGAAGAAAAVEPELEEFAVVEVVAALLEMGVPLMRVAAAVAVAVATATAMEMEMKVAIAMAATGLVTELAMAMMKVLAAAVRGYVMVAPVVMMEVMIPAAESARKAPRGWEEAETGAQPRRPAAARALLVLGLTKGSPS